MMRRKLGSLAIGVISLAAASTVRFDGETSTQTRAAESLAKELQPASSFDEIADGRARSIALFTEAGKVLQHPRCMNCYPGQPGRLGVGTRRWAHAGTRNPGEVWRAHESLGYHRRVLSIAAWGPGLVIGVAVQL
jgi:hypothetical protein